MTLALVAALAFAPQVVVDPRGAWLRARREVFLEAWVAADEPRREAARGELERLTTPGAPALGGASAQALGRAWRTLVREGAAGDARQEALERLAESLDLRAVPGVLEAGASEEPLTVHVLSPDSARWDGPLELRLTWIAPAGAERAHELARTTEAWPDAFTPEGFELFVRTPAGADVGTWRLALELVDGERRADVPPLSVECVRARAEYEDERARAVALELDSWRHSGAPRTPGLLAADLLDERGGRFERVVAGFGKVWVWRPDGALRHVVVLLSPARDAAIAPLCGVRGALWREFARRTGSLLVPLDVGEGGSTRHLELRIESARGFAPELAQAPCVLVARASTAPGVALGRGAEPPFDAWVLCWASSTPPRLPWPELPTRVLSLHAQGDAQPLDPERPAQLVVPGTGEPLLDDLRLPEQARLTLESLAR